MLSVSFKYCDYFALTEDLIKKGKKLILVFAEGHKGKEYGTIASKLFYECSVSNIKNSVKKINPKI